MKDNIKKFSPKKNSLARTGFFSNPLTYFLSLSTKRKFDSLNMVCDKPRASETRIKDDRRCKAINKYAPHLSIWADVGVIRLCARKHRAVFVFNAVSEHPPTFFKVGFVLYGIIESSEDETEKFLYFRLCRKRRSG